MRRTWVCFAIAAIFAGTTPAMAVEYGMGLWPPGFAGFMAGVLPPQPGLYLGADNYAFRGTAGREVRNDAIELNADVGFDAGFLTGTYVSDLHFLDATYAATAVFGYSGMNLTASVATPLGSLSESVSNSGLTDSFITPITLGWHDGNWNWLVAANAYVPTGSFQLRQLNIGRNVWAAMPQASLTYFDPQTGIDLSGTLVYVIQSENNTTNYQSGNVLNFDWAAGMHFGPQWEAGVQGNVVEQTTGDSGSGAKLGAFEARSAGIGPGVSYTTKLGDTPTIATFKWERDFAARNTFSGNILVASATFVF